MRLLRGPVMYFLLCVLAYALVIAIIRNKYYLQEVLLSWQTVATKKEK